MRFAALAIAFAAATALADGAASPPVTVTQEGRLLDALDKPLTTAVPVTFSIYASYDTTSDTTPLWFESYLANVQDGLYAVVLGDTLGSNTGKKELPASLFDKGGRYLAIKVGADAEMAPRLLINPAPYAVRSMTAALADTVPDGTLTAAKLKLVNNQLPGLDAATLSGLDASAFAPSSIQGDITAIRTSVGPGVGADVAALKSAVSATEGADITSIKGAVGATVGSDVGIIKGAVGSTVGADVTALRSAVGATVGVDVVSIKTAVGTSAGADLTAIKSAVATNASNVTALQTAVGATAGADISALKASVATLLGRNGAYSVSCADALSKGWADEDTCLQDHRWHRYFQLNPGTVNSSSTINATKFYAASVSGADVKARLGYDWFYFTARAVDGPNSWYAFATDSARPFMFQVNNAVSGTPSISIWVWQGGAAGCSDGPSIATNGPNKHWVTSCYTNYVLATTNTPGPAEFWARY